MEQGEAMYEFINRYAYFAYPASMILENYSASDGNNIESDVFVEFINFMVEFKNSQTLVHEGRLSREAADAKLRTGIYEYRLDTIDSFMNILEELIVGKTDWNKQIYYKTLSESEQNWLHKLARDEVDDSKGFISAELVKAKLLKDIRKEIRGKNFSTNVLTELIKNIRKLEEMLLSSIVDKG